MASIFPASYLTQDASGYDAWWDWNGQRPDSAPCAALAAVVFVTGVVAVRAHSMAPRRFTLAGTSQGTLCLPIRLSHDRHRIALNGSENDADTAAAVLKRVPVDGLGEPHHPVSRKL